MKTLPIYGMMAEFDSAQHLVDAARRTHEAGYRKIDAYSPFPVEELAEAIGFHKNSVALVALIGGITGGLAGYFMQYWIAVISYPINVGGRPFHSWPSFIIVTFEMTILFGAIFGGLRHAGAQRTAHAIPPGFSTCRGSPGHQRPIFPDRVLFRSQVRRNRHASIFAEPRAAIDLGGPQLDDADTPNFECSAGVPPAVTGASRPRRQQACRRLICSAAGHLEHRRLPSRHARAAALQPAGQKRFLFRPALRAAAGRRHCGPRQMNAPTPISIPAKSAATRASTCLSR